MPDITLSLSLTLPQDPQREWGVEQMSRGMARQWASEWGAFRRDPHTTCSTLRPATVRRLHLSCPHLQWLQFLAPK